MMNSWDLAFSDLESALMDNFSIKAVLHLESENKEISILPDSEYLQLKSKSTQVRYNTFTAEVAVEVFELFEKNSEISIEDQRFLVLDPNNTNGICTIKLVVSETENNHIW